MKIFSIGGFYISRDAPETIEKPQGKNKKREAAKMERWRDGEKEGQRDGEDVVSFLSVSTSLLSLKLTACCRLQPLALPLLSSLSPYPSYPYLSSSCCCRRNRGRV